ncbi:MAG: hypothetical protein NW206_14450 [Hyphomonadaceae bacterium]|nr:hypothetical protein [Hyphomonadaceae bacterium]
MSTSASAGAESRVSLGHLALHYRKREDGPIAARLLEILGCEKVQEIPLPDGPFYQFYVDPNASNNGDGIVYLSHAPAPILAINQAIQKALKVGREDQHPAVAQLREGQRLDPEMCFHLGLLMTSLERIEDLVLTLRALNETDPELRNRINIVLNAPVPGDAKIDARMAASPVFKGVTRHPYGKHALQVFVETDLLMSGPLGENMVIELDYVFPGYAKHLFNSTEA